MPLSLHEYRLYDWCRLRPLTHAFKTRRYQRIDDRYLKILPSLDSVKPIRSALNKRPTLVTIAFNDWQLLEWQTTLVARHIPHAIHLVIDNSPDDGAANRNQCLCHNRGIHYFRLPPNPWTGRNPSRSHGLAMNWSWHHLLRPAQPSAFGFIDHDLLPLEPSDPFAQLASLPCWGDKRWAGSRWFLWAGFCFYRWDAVHHLPLDFGLDWFAGLDTGGANWEVLYRHLNPATLPDRIIERQTAVPGVSTDEEYFERRDTWIHEVGLAGRRELRHQKRQAFRDLVTHGCLNARHVAAS